MSADDKLKELGFELKEVVENGGYAVYVNEKDDQRVEISFDGDRWIIYSETLSEQLDYYGHTYRSPIGMTYEECEALLNKIDELKDVCVLTNSRNLQSLL